MKRSIVNSLFLLFLLVSCKNNQHAKTVVIVKKWIGKEILFPSDYLVQYMGKDTTYDEVFDKEYKVFLYADSLGCTSCQLGLYNWYQRILETNEIAPDKVGFIFFLQPKNDQYKEITYLARRDNFKHPIFIDVDNKINQLNHFETSPDYHCFLLNKDNKVIALGNPRENYLVWEFYKEIFTGKKTDVVTDNTEVSIDKLEAAVENMQVNTESQVVFTLKNEGTKPLVIYHIESSCGCLLPQWDKKPVLPGQKLDIIVSVTPDSKGFFNKNLDIYINAMQQRLTCRVIGSVR